MHELNSYIQENSQLKKINQALIYHIERGMFNLQTAYGTFEHNVHLLNSIQEKTQKLNNLCEQLEQKSQRLQEKNKDLSQAMVSKNKYITGLIHDFFQPVNGAKILLPILKNKLSQDRESLDIVDLLQLALENISNMLNSSIELALIDSEHRLLNREHFFLSEVLTPLFQEYSPGAKQKDLDFSLRFPKNQRRVLSDRNLALRLLQNIITNAIDYTREGEILIIVTNVARGVRVAIKDTGVGINPWNLAKLQKKRRLNSKKTTFSHNPQLGTGLGIGFMLIQEIAHKLQLNLKIKSTKNTGTEMSFVLPVS